MDITKLKGKIPDLIYQQLQEVVDKFAINAELRLAHFLGQCAHESTGFKYFTENLNYSAQGLKGVFKKYFPDDATANAYARQPEKIGARVYANRMGNGPEASMDGFTYRGRGCIQLTGKDNYIAFGKAINEDLVSHPDLVATNYALVSGAWFFSKHGLNELADKGLQETIAITKVINGGTIGLSEREALVNKFYNILIA